MQANSAGNEPEIKSCTSNVGGGEGLTVVPEKIVEHEATMVVSSRSPQRDDLQLALTIKASLTHHLGLREVLQSLALVQDESERVLVEGARSSTQ